MSVTYEGVCPGLLPANQLQQVDFALWEDEFSSAAEPGLTSFDALSKAAFADTVDFESDAEAVEASRHASYEPIKNPGFYLSDVNRLNRFRNPDGTHNEWALHGIRVNKVTAVKEMAMPYTVSPVYQEYRDGSFWWHDQKPEDVPKSGLMYHQDPAALKRVHVEIDEPRDAAANLKPGMIKVFLSPKMSEADASYEVAKREHLGDDDAIRIQKLDVQDGEVKGMALESILVRDIPLKAWTDMLKDPNNIFGKSIELEDEASALSVMKVHSELYLPKSALPEGVVSLLEAVLPYVDDEHYEKVAEHLYKIRETNQGDAHEKAENIAERWLQFEMDLADSLEAGYANQNIMRFIHSLAGKWPEEVTDMLAANTSNGKTRLTPELAAKLEAGRQNTLMSAAAVITNNDRVLDQLSSAAAKQIYDNEMKVQELSKSGMSDVYIQNAVMQMEAQNNQFIAQQKIRVGGGCPGDNDFFSSSEGGKNAAANAATAGGPSLEEQRRWKQTWGKCVVKSCKKEGWLGPCGVCMGRCQKLYNLGIDPTKVKVMSWAGFR